MALNQPTVDLRAQRALKDITEEFEKIRSGLSNEIAGSPIDNAAINNSIQVYNQNRSLLKAIHDFRRKNPVLLKARDMQAIIISTMVMQKEESNNLLAKLLKELEMMPTTQINGIPLFLSGHLCQAPKLELLDIIESLGGLVVDDDMFTGYRYFAKDAEVDGDPIRSLVGRYLEIEPPCPTRFHPNNMWDRYILDRALEVGAKGVIILQPKFCEPQMFAYVHQKKTLTEAGMPHILIETEHEMLSFEGIRTRIQAFLEMIHSSKG
jgi:benzoyl-CoA reductase/2-hydroxyglutaryl-CoA dehydratase subunit BcrC/BadD/HgdB